MKAVAGKETARDPLNRSDEAHEETFKDEP